MRLHRFPGPLGIALATLLAMPLGATAQGCRPDISDARHDLHYVRRLIARNPGRAALHGLSAPDTSLVGFVRDSTTCARALSAFNRSVTFDDGTPASTGVFVVAVNPDTWVVFDPCATPGAYMEYIVFNADFTERLRISP